MIYYSILPYPTSSSLACNGVCRHSFGKAPRLHFSGKRFPALTAFFGESPFRRSFSRAGPLENKHPHGIIWYRSGKFSEDEHQGCPLLMTTLRQRIAMALEENTLDLGEVSKLFRINEREAVDHLDHISKSTRVKRFVMEPACCLECGFSFKKRMRLSTPGKCPLCRSESISPPRFHIIEK